MENTSIDSSFLVVFIGVLLSFRCAVLLIFTILNKTMEITGKGGALLFYRFGEMTLLFFATAEWFLLYCVLLN